MAIIGAILGDIAGSRWEFHRPPWLSPEKMELFTDDNYFTDDTVMTLAAKAAVLNDISFSDSYRQFGRKYPDMGYGSNFEYWLNHPNEKAYNSCGNGSAMRCSYIGEYFNTEIDVIEWATKSAECTHNHPEGIKGAITTAMCVYMARTGATKPDIYKYAASQYSQSNYEYSVEIPIKDYKTKYRWNEVCQGSVPTAIRCFLESESYEDFLRKVLSLRCDADTLCAIGGGIAEEFYRGTGFDDEFLLKKYLSKELYRIVKMQADSNKTR